MIETEKRTLDVEEFSPTEPIYQENVIRHLVRLASLIIIGLLGVSVVQNYLPDFDFYVNILSPMLIFALMLVFLVGIFLAFFQLRWINEKRNKSTNLGGTVGFFGLFVTFMSSVSSLIAIPLAIVILLLGLGLFLTLVGFFAEMTRIDEPLVYWFRVNLEVIIRYTISIVGVFLVNWSLLSIVVLFFVDWGVLTIFVFPGELFGGLIIGGIGLGLVWGSWFHQVNQTIWRYRVEIIRAIELSVGQGFILVSLIVPFLVLDFLFLSSIFGVAGLVIVYLDLYIFKVKVTSHFSKGFVTLSQVIASIIGIILIIIGIIQTQLQSIPDWFFFSVYFPITGLFLLYRVWFDTINYSVKRTVQTIIWFFRTYYREVITTLGVSFMALGSFLFEFTKVINPLLMDELKIDSFFDPLPLGLFLGGFVIGMAIWHIPDRHAYFRGVTTTLSVTVILWGILLLGLLLTPPTSTDELSYVISSFLIVMGICVDGWIWRTEVFHSVKSALILLKNAIVYTINTTVQFLKVYYRELITIGALSFTMYGLVVTWDIILNFPYWPFLFLLMGYIVSVVIWYIPDRHNYFRGVTTTLSTVVILFGFLLLIFQDYQPISWLSGGLVVVSIVVNGTVWRLELKQLAIQTTISFKNALVKIGQAIKNFFIAAKDALIQAGRKFIQFIDETLNAIWDHRIAIMRVFMTSVGSILIITSFLTWSGLYIVFLTWFVGLEFFFFICGVLLLYIAWFHQVNRFTKQSAITIWNTLVQAGHTLYIFLIKVKNTVIEALHTIWLYRVVILRAFATILGPLMILSVAVVPLLEISPVQLEFGIQLVIVISGFCVLYTAWFYQVNHFVKQSLLAIRNAIVKTVYTIKNFFVAAINALVQAGRAFILFIDATLHTIWEHRITILRAMITISGSIMTSIGLLLLFYSIYNVSLISGLELFFILLGLVLLYGAWFHQVNQFVKQLSIAIRDIITQTIGVIHNFFQYTWDHRIDILRAITTTTGSILVLAGLFPINLIEFNIRLVLILGGIILLYIAWLHQVNQFIRQSAVAIGNAIVQTYHTIIQFLQTYYIEIIRYSATCIGVLSLILGFISIFQDPLGLLLLGGGCVILYAAWFHQVNQFIIQTLQMIKEAFVHAARTFHNLLINVKNAIVSAFYALGAFMRKVGFQLNQLFRATVDLIIPIILILLAFSVSFYGVIVLISGFVDISGVSTSEFFISIPILGSILEFFAALIQWGTYERNLLGFFADSPFLIPLGAALIVVGVVILLFVALKKENMRLKTLLNTPNNINSGKGGK